MNAVKTEDLEDGCCEVGGGANYQIYVGSKHHRLFCHVLSDQCGEETCGYPDNRANYRLY